MMSVLEYANDVDKKVEEILTLCKKMDINVSNCPPSDEHVKEMILLRKRTKKSIYDR